MPESLEQNYARGGFERRLTPGSRPALLVVDFVRAYLVEESPLYGGDGCASARLAAIELLAGARAAGIPVLHTNVEYQPGGRDGGVFFRKVPALKVFCAGNPLGDVIPELAPTDGEPVVTKQYASAFFATSLASTLHAQGVDCVLLAGI